MVSLSDDVVIATESVTVPGPRTDKSDSAHTSTRALVPGPPAAAARRPGRRARRDRPTQAQPLFKLAASLRVSRGSPWPVTRSPTSSWQCPVTVSHRV
jgi:hypothetical protein